MTATEHEYDLAIVGGGIAGLSASLEAKNQGLKFILLESSSRLGGCLRSSKLAGGYTVEAGPNSFSLGSTLENMLQKLSLRPLPANHRAKQKFIYKNNRLNLVSPTEILFSKQLLSLRSRLGILQEVFRSFQDTPREDCSVQDFVVRHFGEEVANNLVWPILTGIYAGNPACLSAKSVLATLWHIEKKHGSLLRGLLKEGLQIPKRQIYSFEGGLEELALKIQEFIGSPSYRLNATVNRIEIETDGGFKLLTNDQAESFRAKKLILATPAFISAKLLPCLEKLTQIPYAPVLTASLWLPKNLLSLEFQRISENSFGFLKARNQESKLLGLVFNSALFPARAPEGFVACTGFLGGFNDPGAVSLSDREIEQILQEELLKIFSIKGDLKMLSRWPQGIPQYMVGHSALITEVQSKLPPNFKLAGNYLRGVSLEEAAKSGKLAFDELFN